MRILIIILALVVNNLHGQSPFEFLVLSLNNKVMEIKYDGRLNSVADSDTTVLRPFKFVSIGGVKKSFVVADGSVYTKFLFGSKQIVIVESSRKSIGKSTNWKAVIQGEIERFHLNISLKGIDKKRASYCMQLEDCKIYLINIKREEVELFKWMLNTLEFY